MPPSGLSYDEVIVGRGAWCHLRLFLSACLSALISLGGCASSDGVRPQAGLERFEYSQVHMGVRARVVLYAAGDDAAADAARAAFERIAELDAMMSDYRRDSELMRLSAAAGGGPVRVSAELFEVLAFAKELHARSGGAFDVTAGPAVRLWREMRQTGALAPPGRMSAARSLIGSQWMRLDAEAQTVELLRPGMQLDLGGIAKGYACDAASTVLHARGLDRHLVDMAGDIVVGEAPPGERAWEIAMEGGANRSAGETVRLLNAAISTSGDAEQFVEIEGRRYAHIVDPRTGLGSPRRVSATVVAPRGMMSDAIATALCLLPIEEGMKLARSYPGVVARTREADEPDPSSASTAPAGRMKSVP